MGYKTKAEKRAYKDGLFAGLFGKKRKRKKAANKRSSLKKRKQVAKKQNDAGSRALRGEVHTYEFIDEAGFGTLIKGYSFDDAERKLRKQMTSDDLEPYKVIRGDGLTKFL